MATVKVQRVKGRNPITKEEFYYVRTKSAGIMSTSDLIDNIVREGQIPRIYAQGVLDYLTTAVFDYMKAGLSVQVPGLGTLKLNVKSKAQKTEKEATAYTITGSKLQLIPFESTKEEMRRFKYQLVGGTAEEDGSGEDEDEVPSGPDDENGQPPTPTPPEETEYTATFKYHDNTEDSVTAPAGAPLNAPAPDSGYTWSPTPPATMPAANTTYVEVAESETTYTIAWYDNHGQPLAYYHLPVGATVPEAPAPPEGYRWPTFPTTMPDHDVDVQPVAI